MVAIMQPTYLPWIGYFAMIDRVDVFVLLDSVQFARRSWQQRNVIKTATGPQTLTVPVQHEGHQDVMIAEARIPRIGDFADTHCKSINHAYAKAPFYADYAPQVLRALARPCKRLGDYTIAIIETLCRCLGITTSLLRSSDLPVSGRKAALLVAICEEIGADHYLAVPGSRAYLEAAPDFPEAGIDVSYHEFRHPAYAQLHGKFLPYMSAIDLLFNNGPQSLAVLRQGVEAPLTRPPHFPSTRPG